MGETEEHLSGHCKLARGFWYAIFGWFDVSMVISKDVFALLESFLVQF